MAGRDVTIALFAGSLLGVVPAVVALVRMGGKDGRRRCRTGRSLAAGGVVGLFFGEALLDAWLG